MLIIVDDRVHCKSSYSAYLLPYLFLTAFIHSILIAGIIRLSYDNKKIIVIKQVNPQNISVMMINTELYESKIAHNEREMTKTHNVTMSQSDVISSAESQINIQNNNNMDANNENRNVTSVIESVKTTQPQYTPQQKIIKKSVKQKIDKKETINKKNNQPQKKNVISKSTESNQLPTSLSSRQEQTLTINTEKNVTHQPFHEHNSPIIIKRNTPRYPKQAQTLGIEGRIIVKFDINQLGAVENIRFILAEPKGVFEKEVQRTMKSWRYKATAKKDIMVTIKFKLNQQTVVL